MGNSRHPLVASCNVTFTQQQRQGIVAKTNQIIGIFGNNRHFASSLLPSLLSRARYRKNSPQTDCAASEILCILNQWSNFPSPHSCRRKAETWFQFWIQFLSARLHEPFRICHRRRTFVGWTCRGRRRRLRLSISAHLCAADE